MTVSLRKIWNDINASYWFYPSLFAVGSLVLALFTIWLDRAGYASFLDDIPAIQEARPDGASNMLSVIAGSMIGVASTVFSITIAAVAYASGNYGPRLLTNFMENKGNQLSLATFIGTFVYAITVLRVVRAEDEATLLDSQAQTLNGFVPQLSLLVGYILMGLSIAVLVYFLNHIPASIRINSVLKGIGERLIRDIKADFDQPMRRRVDASRPEGREVVAELTGYIQVIDFARLERIAHAAGGHLMLDVRTGDFVHPDVVLAVWDDDDTLDDLRDDEIRDCFALGGMRTPNQDLHFLIDELVEIGLRALSPGINDPFTAISALHWLGAATAELGHRELTRSFNPDAEREDDNRLALLADGFDHFVDRGFGSMRSGVATSPTAATVMLDCLQHAATTIEDPNRRRRLVLEGERLIQQARIDLAGPNLEQVEAHYQLFAKNMDR